MDLVSHRSSRQVAPHEQRAGGLWLGLLGLGLVLALTRSVAAQPSDPTRDASARVLFDEGVSLADKGDWQGAEDRFRRALSLRASPVIAYNLASALAERGKLIEASEILRKIEHDDKTDAAMQRAVQSKQSDLSKRIGRIRVTVRSKRANDRITLDGHPLLEAQLGVEIPIDPGAHRLSLERAGRKLDSQSVGVATGTSVQVTLKEPFAPTPHELAAASERTSAAASSQLVVAYAPDADPGVTSEASPITGRWWFWTGAGAVAIATVVLVAMAAGSSGRKPEPAYQGSFTSGSLQIQVVP